MPENSPPPDSALEGGDHTVIRSAGSPTQEPSPGPLFAGRYALVRMLGRGGMGTVYQARDSLVGDVVALKTLELGKDAGPDALERFSREVRLARRITHPHVARMHDLGTHEGQAFLTMEFVEGEDLRALLARERPLAASRAARIALAICEGLAAAHAAGVVHRDLKPANILVEAGGRVVLTDFGIARAVAGEVASRTMGAVGTPMYMAPEQVSGEQVDARADLYAVGLLLYELLTGEVPFSGETPWAAAMARLRQTPPDLRQRATVPAPLSELVHRCLGRAPEERPASALEVAGALRDWLVSVGEPTLSGPPTQGPMTGGHIPGLGASTFTTRNTPRTTTPTPKQGVAILPLRFQGPRDSEYLGDSLTEALIDQLSRARGLRVPGSGVTARFRNERDPRTVGRELGVDLVVEGTVQSAGPAVRVSIRLLEAQSGTQVWSGRFEYTSTDAFELQDRLVPRIAEELRGEVVLLAWRASTPPEVLALYRQADTELHAAFRGGHDGGPLVLLESCLEQAPDFAPAIALHAIASLRVMFMGMKDAQRDHAAAARASVERALHLAPEIAETHLARAMLSAQVDDWRTAVSSLRTALDIAPCHAPTLQYLGSLQCEAGRADEGLVRLRLAYDLSPTLVTALFELARCSALRGKMDDYWWAVERLSASPSHRAAAESLRVRVAGWTRNTEELRRSKAETAADLDFIAVITGRYAAAALGEVSALELIPMFEESLSRTNSPRFVSLMCQISAEILGLCGHAEQAMGYFRRAVETALIDLEWIDRCPALVPLRTLPGFAEGRRQVRSRVEAIWLA
ncbi:serine/threonine-protein kinase [Archangium lansingense]|uniref:Protein kinase n=1 Tax=Archangium lansingense TaxID=2995310 RepID=A0ABT4A068_9BACT|nr:serine/threonine-protein kinase [Archangium lansinium]MCY1075008.1 protein kinase [Archangium lansinium]